jgi:hypothetical protein
MDSRPHLDQPQDARECRAAHTHGGACGPAILKRSEKNDAAIGNEGKPQPLPEPEAHVTQMEWMCQGG